jgi:hypothetical protein
MGTLPHDLRYFYTSMTTNPSSQTDSQSVTLALMTSLQPLALGIIVGSLRSDSVTRRLANTLGQLTPPSFDPRIIQIGDLPLYNEDLDIEVAVEPPHEWARFRNEVRASDAILFVTPEYINSFATWAKRHNQAAA